MNTAEFRISDIFVLWAGRLYISYVQWCRYWRTSNIRMWYSRLENSIINQTDYRCVKTYTKGHHPLMFLLWIPAKNSHINVHSRLYYRFAIFPLTYGYNVSTPSGYICHNFDRTSSKNSNSDHFNINTKTMIFYLLTMEFCS